MEWPYFSLCCLQDSLRVEYLTEVSRSNLIPLKDLVEFQIRKENQTFMRL